MNRSLLPTQLPTQQRLLASLLIIINLSSFALAQETSPDGTWKWSSELGGQTINSVLRLEAQGKEIIGTYENQNMKTEIKNGKLESGEIAFDFSVNMQGTDVTVAFKGKVSEDEIAGDVKFVSDGNESQSYDWTCARHVGPQEVVGKWQFNFTSPDNVEHSPVLEIMEKGNKLSGEFENGVETIEIEDIKIENNTLNFKYTGSFQGSDLKLKYVLYPRGNKISGDLEYDLNGQVGDFPVKAERIRPKKNLLLAGVWEFVIIDPDGNEQPVTLTLTNVEGKLKASLSTAGEELEVKDFESKDNKVSFKSMIMHDNAQVDLRWQTSADGETMTGTVEYSVGDETGELPLKGKRNKDI